MLRELVIEVVTCGRDAYEQAHDAAEVARLTGAACAVHVDWDEVEDHEHLRAHLQARGLHVAPAGDVVVYDADWGVALLECLRLGEHARVALTSGQGAGRIAALLAAEDRLGAVRFDPRAYAPFELFLVFAELAPRVPWVAIAGAHDVEALVLAVIDLHEAFAKARLVDEAALREAREFGDEIGAREVLLDAFRTDVRPVCAAARAEVGAAEDPLMALRQRELIR